MISQELISQVYSAFNRRDIDATLVLMSENVSWPKASEGGRVVGKQAIRDYWTRQWAEFDPRVDVLEVVDHEMGKTDVKVHQLVHKNKFLRQPCYISRMQALRDGKCRLSLDETRHKCSWRIHRLAKRDYIQARLRGS